MNTGCWGNFEGKSYDVIRTEEDAEQLFHCIKANIIGKQNHINELQKELEELKENYNKNEEIAKLIKERDQYKNDYYRGFPISESEDKLIKNWINEHEMKHPSGHGVSGGKYEYVFTPTALGTIGIIKCNCGKSFCFTDIY